jgi:hypothetical protein
LNQYLPIAPSDPINGIQLSLRGGRTLDKPSYVKKVRFEVDVRLLALCAGGARAETLRLTKGSFKVLLREITAAVVPWVPLPGARLAPIAPRMVAAVKVNTPRIRDLEAQPLLERSSPRSPGQAVGGDETVVGHSYGMIWWIWLRVVEPPLKLVLCFPTLAVLIVVVTIKALLAPVCVALLKLFRVIFKVTGNGPVLTCNHYGKLLLGALTGEDLARAVDRMKDDEYERVLEPNSKLNVSET